LSMLAAAVNVALSLALVRHVGALGVIGGTILSYLIVLVVPQTLIVRSVWRKELAARGKALFAYRSSPFANS
jgi:O-antigen/teichoic acid export membrane protein